MHRLLLSTTALVFLSLPVLAEPHGRDGRGAEAHDTHVGKASVAPQVQERAQAELRHESAAPSGFERGRGPQATAPQAIQAPQYRGEQLRDRDHGEWRG